MVGEMLFRFTKLWVAMGLMVALWALGLTRQPPAQTWVRPIGLPPGPVKILQFYASVGMLTQGDKALLCYGVENAKSVRISPTMDNVYPALNHCLEIGPEHTTHYTIVAEGYDGRVATKSFTLPVQGFPPAPPRRVNYADLSPVSRPSYSAATGSTAAACCRRS
jgi:hypothetical protein